MKTLVATFLVLALLATATMAGSPSADKITQLPGWPVTAFDMYSGYLDAGNNNELHYIFVESQNSPRSSPLVIWLNGGPGCSSLLGFIQENGPYLFTGINTFFTENLGNSWNQNANVLYIEGPPGVGFSKVTKPYTYSDENSGIAFFNALVSFRTSFSSVVNFSNKLWLTGESYAGMYVPFFAKQIVDYNKSASNKFNFKGFMIGNNVFASSNTLLNDATQLQYVRDHFFNNEISQLYKGCEKGRLNADCQKFNQYYNDVTNNTDPYSIYNYTYSYGGSGQSKQMREAQLFTQEERIEEYMKQEVKKSQVGGATPTPDDIITEYFNLQQVRDALHITGDQKWEECSNYIGIFYHRANNSTYLYPEFIDAGLDILIYSGNDDAVVPYEYTWDSLNELFNYNSVTVTKQGKYRPWKPLPNKQAGGMVQYYKTNSGSTFAFAMVRGAGHEVPMYQPISAYHMFNNFLNGTPI